MEKIRDLVLTTKTNDVDKKGRVTVGANGIGVEDSQGDISMPGSFDNTLKNNLYRMKWLKDHDPTKLLGVPLEGEEKDGNLVMVGQLNMEKQMCRDVYADYKLMAEYGRTLEHSIGVRALKRNPANKKEVLEWEMWEYSTLSFLGANPQTFLIDIKSATPNQVRDAIEILQKALTMPEYSDLKLNKIDMSLKRLLMKANGAGRIVQCPYCGELIDYDAYKEITVTDEVLDYARMYADWMVSDIVYDRIQAMKPEIQAEVTAIIDSFGSSGLKNKSILETLSYIRCPHCWSRIYSTELEEQNKQKADDAKPEEEEQTEQTEEQNEDEGKEEEKKKSFKSFLSGITNKM